MFGTVLAHDLAATSTVMFSLCDAEVCLAAVAVVGGLVGRPIGSHRAAIAQLFGNLRPLLHFRHLQLAHAQLNAELFQCLLIFVVFFSKSFELRLRFFVFFRVLRVLTDLQLKLRDELFVFQFF